MTLQPNQFNVSDLDSEIAVDGRCCELLKQFHQQLLQEGIDPLEAGQIAHGADYFLRDFIIADRYMNLFTIEPCCVRQFAGHWYIIKNLEPNIKELATILQGVAVFYAYLHQNGHVSQSLSEQIQTETADLELYSGRIDQFWQIIARDRLFETRCSRI
ncbi:MAG: hypothetical protein B6I37_01450 [Desulfobacteraceae bacterium 4572_35.2]|nr:MAG: hypothetical protein B6I37_01450 [Desulfobacteraceae bacterium 4572_35.2]